MELVEETKWLESRIARVQALRATEPDLAICYVVLRRWSAAHYFGALFSLIDGLSEARRSGWLANFTKVSLLCGSPYKLSARVNFDVVNEDVAFLLLPAEPRPRYLLGVTRRLVGERPLALGATCTSEAVQHGCPRIILSPNYACVQHAIVGMTHLMAEFWLQEGCKNTGLPWVEIGNPFACAVSSPLAIRYEARSEGDTNAVGAVLMPE